MKNRQLRRFGSVTLLCLFMALLTSANAALASSYAVSYNTISGFALGFGGGAGKLSPFTLSVDASVTNYGLDGGLSMKDAPAACVPASCTLNNSFTSHGYATEYAYGDAQIVSRNVLAGIGAANSIGEISAFNSMGLAGGSNTMLASFSVVGSGTVNFSFSAAPYMNTLLTSGGTSANAHQLMYISVSQGSTKFFEWKPDGVLGNALGGTESSDPFSLNSAAAGNATFNPGSGNFAAGTSTLSAGTYDLKITMANYVDAAATTVVPVPAAVWLFASGLAAFIPFRRRRK